MGFSARELMLLSVQVEDGASGPLNTIGQNVQRMTAAVGRGSLNAFAYSQAWDRAGQSLTRAGLAILAGAGASVKAASDFGHGMSLVNTQAQLTSGELDDLGDSALKISSRYGIAATEITEALYDIFSTTEATMPEAIKMTNALAKASVAGATEMRTITRGVVDIQNAFGKAAGNTTDILDLQFQTLRKSGGTYDELVSAFGNVIGAAKDTDQSIQSVSGAIAFLTLRGRTQAQASISVSRALDQISKSAGAIGEVLDVNVFDKAGDFRNLEDIINDMGMAMEDMTSKERATAFQDMFGAGSIQANRFFRTAIPQFAKLNKSVDDLSKKEIAGQLEKAFRTMKKEDPSFIFRRLAESLKNIGIRLANEVIPVVQDWLRTVRRWIDSYRELSPETQRLIATLIPLAGVLLLVTGRVLSLMSGIASMISIAKLAGLSFGAMYGSVLLVLGGIALLIAAGVLLVKNWDEVSAFWDRNWKTIRTVAVAGATLIILMLAKIRGGFMNIIPAVGKTTGQIAAATSNWRMLLSSTQGRAALLKGAIRAVATAIKGLAIAWFVTQVFEVVRAFGEGRKKADKFFEALENGKKSVEDAGDRIDKVREKLDDLTDVDNFGEIFSNFFKIPSMVEAQSELNRLKENLQEYRNETFWMVEAVYRSDEAFRRWGVTIQGADDLNRKQQRSLAEATNILDIHRESLGRSTKATIRGYIEGGHYKLAMDLIKKSIKENLGPLKNLLDPEQKHNENLADMAQKARQAAGAEDDLKNSQKQRLGPLKNLLTPEQLHNENLADMAQKAKAAAGAQKNLSREHRNGINPLKDILPWLSSYASYAATAAREANAAASAQRNLNSAIAAAPQGGGHPGGSGGGGGGSGGGGGTSGTSQQGRGTGNITVNARTTATAAEIAREVDWARRTRGFQ